MEMTLDLLGELWTCIFETLGDEEKDDEAL